VLGYQLGLATFQGSAVQAFGLAWKKWETRRLPRLPSGHRRNAFPLRQRTQLGLLQFALPLQEKGQVVHSCKGVRVIRAKQRFEPCKTSAIKWFGLTALDGARRCRNMAMQVLWCACWFMEGKEGQNYGPQSLDYSERKESKHMLRAFGLQRHAKSYNHLRYSIWPRPSLTDALSHETTWGWPRRRQLAGWSAISNVVQKH
jgi:hypothetical protein